MDFSGDDVLPVGYLDRHGYIPADPLAVRAKCIAQPGGFLIGFLYYGLIPS